MKVYAHLVLIYGILIGSAILVTSFSTYHYTEDAIISSEINEMRVILNEKSQQIESLHTRATEDLVFALKNPLFVEYFELPETKAGNVYENGILQFTDNQHQIKNQLEQWIYHFQNKFQVDETCIIDTSGQEHARLVLGKIETDKNLSPDEEFAPFFEPSFKKDKEQVHVQYPYVSPDTNRWVFAYVSPVILGDGQKPAIYHFEMPITVFQQLVEIDSGRMYVIDPQGIIIADSYGGSLANAKYNISPMTITDFAPKEYFPRIEDSMRLAFNTMVSTSDGYTKYNDDNGKEHYIIYKKLSHFDWILAYEKPKNLLLTGNTTLGELGSTILITSIVIMASGFVGVIIFSSTISRPITRLRRAAEDVADGMLDIKIKLEGSTEMQDLISTFTKITESLRKTTLERDMIKRDKTENSKNEK